MVGSIFKCISNGADNSQPANYDDLATPTIVSLTSIGVYDGLNYTGLGT